MLDEFLEARSGLSRGGPRWWWDHSGLTDGQRNSVVEACARPDIPDKAVQIVLGQWGVKVTSAQVGHLRRKLADG